MIEILEMTVTKPFRYLWLKSVTGVSLSAHCARCLKGTYDERIGPDVIELNNITLHGDLYYLCGVSKPYRWENNFHLAFKRKDGATLRYSDNGISVIIENAERIEITADAIDHSLPQAAKKEFCTCRNWQFANWLKRQMMG